MTVFSLDGSEIGLLSITGSTLNSGDDILVKGDGFSAFLVSSIVGTYSTVFFSTIGSITGSGSGTLIGSSRGLKVAVSVTFSLAS